MFWRIISNSANSKCKDWLFNIWKFMNVIHDIHYIILLFNTETYFMVSNTCLPQNHLANYEYMVTSLTR